MGEVMTRLQVFHRLGLFLGIAAGMSFIGTAALFVRWEIGPAIACLAGFRGQRRFGRRREKMDMEKTELLENKKVSTAEFRVERERLVIHSRERIGGEH